MRSSALLASTRMHRPEPTNTSLSSASSPHFHVAVGVLAPQPVLARDAAQLELRPGLASRRGALRDVVQANDDVTRAGGELADENGGDDVIVVEVEVGGDEVGDVVA